MNPLPIESTRIQDLNQKDPGNSGYVLYWMQQAQRAEDNPALEYAVFQANQLRRPLLVVFGLSGNYPEANRRHYTFLLEGLRETQATLRSRGIQLSVAMGHPPEVALKAAEEAALVVCDRGYLRHQKLWRRKVAQEAVCKVVQVEGEVVVPTQMASRKKEYSARTLRPKIQRLLPEYLFDCPDVELGYPSPGELEDSMDLSDPETLLEQLGLNSGLEAVSRFFHGGTSQAKKLFRDFLEEKFERYSLNRNQPQTDDVSHMGMYLHFGQISPVWLAGQVHKLGAGLSDQKDAFLEELIVRRELAVNFTEHTPDYDAYSCIPDWAAKTLEEHRKDPRDPCYGFEDLEAAATEDSYWNAAMNEMKLTGYMHNYMRMYWGKQILKWSADPAQAFADTLTLNNRYFLDGRDSNSFTGVAWIYGVHDRGWPGRSIFGTVRSMTPGGLERKCDIQGYVRKVDQLRRQAVGR